MDRLEATFGVFLSQNGVVLVRLFIAFFESEISCFETPFHNHSDATSNRQTFGIAGQDIFGFFLSGKNSQFETRCVTILCRAKPGMFATVLEHKTSRSNQFHFSLFGFFHSPKT
jgi:hypothetical protein